MANSWVTFVKAWSAKHGKSYMCAVSDPKCRADYKTRAPSSVLRGIKAAKKRMVSEASARETMGGHDVNVGRAMTHTEKVRMKNSMLSQRANPKGLGPVSFMGSKYF